MEKINCPHCGKELEVTSQGVECRGNNPFHIFKKTLEDIRIGKEWQEKWERKLLYGKEQPHKVNGKQSSFRCGEELYGKFHAELVNQILGKK